jgi:hypothetical protein
VLEGNPFLGGNNRHAGAKPVKIVRLSREFTSRDFRSLAFRFRIREHPAISCHSAYVLHFVPLFVPACWLVRGPGPNSFGCPGRTYKVLKLPNLDVSQLHSCTITMTNSAITRSELSLANRIYHLTTSDMTDWTLVSVANSPL